MNGRYHGRSIKGPQAILERYKRTIEISPYTLWDVYAPRLQEGKLTVPELAYSGDNEYGEFSSSDLINYAQVLFEIYAGTQEGQRFFLSMERLNQHGGSLKVLWGDSVVSISRENGAIKVLEVVSIKDMIANKLRSNGVPNGNLAQFVNDIVKELEVKNGKITALHKRLEQIAIEVAEQYIIELLQSDGDRQNVYAYAHSVSSITLAPTAEGLFYRLPGGDDDRVVYFNLVPERLATWVHSGKLGHNISPIFFGDSLIALFFARRRRDRSRSLHRFVMPLNNKNAYAAAVLKLISKESEHFPDNAGELSVNRNVLLAPPDISVHEGMLTIRTYNYSSPMPLLKVPLEHVVPYIKEGSYLEVMNLYGDMSICALRLMDREQKALHTFYWQQDQAAQGDKRAQLRMLLERLRVRDLIGEDVLGSVAARIRRFEASEDVQAVTKILNLLQGIKLGIAKIKIERGVAEGARKLVGEFWNDLVKNGKIIKIIASRFIKSGADLDRAERLVNEGLSCCFSSIDTCSNTGARSCNIFIARVYQEFGIAEDCSGEGCVWGDLLRLVMRLTGERYEILESILDYVNNRADHSSS